MGGGGLASRIAEALRYYGFFIIQRGIDDPEAVRDVLRRAGVGLLLELKPIGSDFLLLRVRERGCTSDCKYGECSGISDERELDECLRRCVERCLAERLRMVVERLERIAECGGTCEGGAPPLRGG